MSPLVPPNASNALFRSITRLRWPGGGGSQPRVRLEIFNAVGDTITVVTLPESQIEPLTEDEVLSVCSRTTGS